MPDKDNKPEQKQSNAKVKELDGVSRFIIESCDVRGHIVHLDKTWVVARGRMDYPQVIQGMLGETFAATVLLASTIKYEGKLTLQVRGPGPVHLLIVQVTNDGCIRGLARWEEVPESDSLQALFGSEARMTISVEADAMGQPHQGIVELKGDNISAALRNYFHTSEQLDTELYLAANHEVACGMLLQCLPGNASSIQREGWTRAVELANTLTDDELLALDSRTLLHRLYHQEEVRLFEKTTIKFDCSCSRERTDGVIQGLGEVEANAIIAEQGGLSITCEFCAEEYTYDAVDVTTLFRSSVTAEHPATRH